MTRLIRVSIGIGDSAATDIGDTGEIRSFDETGSGTRDGFRVVAEYSVGTIGGEGTGTIGDGFGLSGLGCVSKRRDSVSALSGFGTVEVNGDVGSSGGGVSGNRPLHDDDVGV